ncbi:uncharacterized protein LOC129596545 [Paramacrobiotus metropolitanus]|uniref:uncharacterized protein LOC129596545 n=1 Tax=Paramacrobiotus metropolitanus TaxID=2943436 RepID=UPI00244603F7|nr:uncharacterized protein LOC129596545 [Paramacrobiotus metropolitanus]
MVVFGIIQILVGLALMINDIIGFIIFPSYNQWESVSHRETGSSQSSSVTRITSRLISQGSLPYSAVGSVFLVMGSFFVIIGMLGIKAGERLPVGTPPSSRMALLIASIDIVMSILGAVGSVVLIALSVVTLGPSVQFGLHIVMFLANLGQSTVAGINLCKLTTTLKGPQQIIVRPSSTCPGVQALFCGQDGQPVYVVLTPSAGPTAPTQQESNVGPPLIKQNNVNQKV